MTSPSEPVALDLDELIELKAYISDRLAEGKGFSRYLKSRVLGNAPGNLFTQRECAVTVDVVVFNETDDALISNKLRQARYYAVVDIGGQELKHPIALVRVP